jgi:hypothetical protein
VEAPRRHSIRDTGWLLPLTIKKRSMQQDSTV